MYFTGVDIGSTSAKVVVLNEEKSIEYKTVIPTGWNSLETANNILNKLNMIGVTELNTKFVATGYGRVSVPYANKTLTEITCHGLGAAYLFKDDTCTVIDIGGQDTKIITLSKGQVVDFIMNDKCSAGTGRFLEIMANTLGLGLMELCELAKLGSPISISSMCTVFAESEVISLIGSGKPKEDIAFGIIDSITNKVKSLSSKHSSYKGPYYLTGGLCDSTYIIETLSIKLGSNITSSPMGRFAGALGAALYSQSLLNSTERI